MHLFIRRTKGQQFRGGTFSNLVRASVIHYMGMCAPERLVLYLPAFIFPGASGADS